MKSNPGEVLTPDHRNWSTFRKRLGDAVTIYADGKLLNQCNGDLTLTIEILESMKNIDVKETLILFKEFGGACDCKISVNVARLWNNR